MQYLMEIVVFDALIDKRAYYRNYKVLQFRYLIHNMERVHNSVVLVCKRKLNRKDFLRYRSFLKVNVLVSALFGLARSGKAKVRQDRSKFPDCKHGGCPKNKTLEVPIRRVPVMPLSSQHSHF
jgi:hypothetical protein